MEFPHIRYCLPIIAQTSSETVIPELLVRLRNLSRSDIEAIQRLGGAAVPPEIVETLLRISHDQNMIRGSSAVEALGRLGAATPEVLTRLLELSHDKYMQVSAVEALGRLGVATPEVLTRLLELSHDEYMRDSAVEALVRLGAATPELLTRLLEPSHDQKKDVRHYVAEALRRLMAVLRQLEGLPRLPEQQHSAARRGRLKALQTAKTLGQIRGHGLRFFETPDGKIECKTVGELSQ